MDRQHFQSFGSLEELFAAQEANHNAAMARLTEQQKVLLKKRAFCWVKPESEAGVFVFGRHDLDEEIATEAAIGGPGPSRAELEHRALDRGYKYSECASPLCPEGELGSVHVSRLFEITPQAYKQAKAVGWVIDRTTKDRAPVLYLELAAYAAAETETVEIYRRPAEAGD